jgi:hypothetical protein
MEMMMEALTRIAIFYGIAGGVIGLFVSAMDDVSGTFRGRPIRHARIWGGLFAALIWPAVVWQIVMPRRH